MTRMSSGSAVATSSPKRTILRDRLADWLEPQIDDLRALRPELPGRARRPCPGRLGAAARDRRPRRRRLARPARTAAVALSTGEERDDESIDRAAAPRHPHGLRRLGRRSDANRRPDRPAREIEESPWGDWYGKTISPQALSKLLKPYRIKTMPVWVDGETVQGYKVEQFADAFARVLGRYKPYRPYIAFAWPNGCKACKPYPRAAGGCFRMGAGLLGAEGSTDVTDPLPELLDARRLASELGITRAAAEAIMRRLPIVQIEDLRKTYVRRSDVARYIEARTFSKTKFQRKMPKTHQWAGTAVNGPAPTPGGKS